MKLGVIQLVAIDGAKRGEDDFGLNELAGRVVGSVVKVTLRRRCSGHRQPRPDAAPREPLHGLNEIGEHAKCPGEEAILGEVGVGGSPPSPARSYHATWA